jgi:cephalosporin hydroxylase
MKYYIEESLDIPLGIILPSIQDAIMYGTSYFGVKTLKNPLDAWIYQEILFELQPDVVVEIGVRHGGSTLYLAHLCDQINHGRVIGLDLSLESVPEIVRSHQRIHLIEADACSSFPAVSKLIRPHERVIVIEDSAHTYDHTLRVLSTYSPLVKEGDYFIVEDGICHHGLDVGPSPGPFEAIEEFLKLSPEFELDRNRERYVITWNPKGYLRRRMAI